MTPFRSKVNRFFYRNGNKGIRNLMLYVGVGNLAIYVLTLLNPTNPLFYDLFRFDFSGLFSGEVWRLLTFPLCYLTELDSPFFGILTLFFFYWCGSVLEQSWGVLRSNCYYLCGVLLTDLVGLLIGLAAKSDFGSWADAAVLSYVVNAAYVNMSLMLAVATLLPDQMVRIYFVIPVKMKWLAWLDVGLIVYHIFDWTLKLIRYRLLYLSTFLALLVPLVSIVSYLLFFGKGAAAILPDFIRYRPTRKSWQRKVAQGSVYTDTGAGRSRGAARGASARFRCTVCGRTELTNPNLEFRYCSKCAGYRCYCADHIQNHVHITE